MTVKCLSDETQNNIVNNFIDKIYSIEQLATVHSRSRRTIIRVLEDAGVDPGIRRRQSKPKQQPLTIGIDLGRPEGDMTARIDYRAECWPESPHAQASLCMCKDRPGSQCPGEWEPGCDLGSNPKFVTYLTPTPKPAWYRRVWRAIVATATGTCV